MHGEWSVPVTIGSKDNVNSKHDIIAVLANQTAQEIFSSYMENCKNTSSWPGMIEIPDGSVRYDYITVKRV
jgi:hypothetical protein